MSFESRSTDELVRIVGAGAGLTMEAAGRSTADLVRIAEAAADWGVPVTLRGVQDRSADDLVLIAEAGQGTVIFSG